MKETKEIRKIKMNKGITLIALVVTIVVLLILAGISISMLGGENGIITQAQTAKLETRGATVKEQRDIWMAEKEMDAALETNNAQELSKLISDLYKIGDLTKDEADEILYGIGYITIGSHFIDFRIDGEIEVNGVARIEYVLYDTLQDAFDAVPADGTKVTVYLLKDIWENTLVEENKNIVLNMGGHTITNIEGTAVSENREQPVFEVFGELELQTGEIIAEYGSVVENYGDKVEIKEDVWIIEQGTTTAICNFEDGEINITGGVVSSKYSTISNNTGTINIKGDSIIEQFSETGGGITISNMGGIINISENAEIITTGGYFIAIYNCEEGIINIKGGNIESYRSNAVVNESGIINMDGGKIVGYILATIDNRGTFNVSGDAQIIAYKRAVINNSGTTMISENAQIIGKGSLEPTISNSGTFTMSGGTVTAEAYTYAIMNDGTAEITGGTINGETNLE